MSIILQSWNGHKIRFETRQDGKVWGCLTDMANATGKKVSHYLALKSTKEYLKGLLRSEINQTSNAVITASVDMKGFESLIEVGTGNFTGKEQGTWAVDVVVIDFGQWCNVDFRI